MTAYLQGFALCVAFLAACLMLAHFARTHMTGDNPDRIAAKQLQTARRLQLDHAAQAEYHEALARMYDAQARRLAARAPTAPGASPAQAASVRAHIIPAGLS